MIYTLTFHYSHNYGAFLQSFALQKKIKDSQVINYVPDYTFYIGNKLRYIPFLRNVLGVLRKKKFLSSIKSVEYQQLKMTSKMNINQMLDFSLSNSNSYIVGSDQVWNSQFISSLENIYFLNFVHFSAKRISYAASLGVKQWPKEFEQKVLPMLQRFDAISVREESSVPYLTSLGLKNVVCVCDPTILHKGDFYREQFQGAIVDSKRYVFIYKIRELIPDSVSEILPTNVKTVELQKRKTMVSVTQWLANIDHAEFVVTDSFHCAVFCILFHKPFLVIPNRSHGKGMNERFATLLGGGGFSRFITTDANIFLLMVTCLRIYTLDVLLLRVLYDKKFN